MSFALRQLDDILELSCTVQGDEYFEPDLHGRARSGAEILQSKLNAAVQFCQWMRPPLRMWGRTVKKSFGAAIRPMAGEACERANTAVADVAITATAYDSPGLATGVQPDTDEESISPLAFPFTFCSTSPFAPRQSLYSEHTFPSAEQKMDDISVGRSVREMIAHFEALDSAQSVFGEIERDGTLDEWQRTEYQELVESDSEYFTAKSQWSTNTEPAENKGFNGKKRNERDSINSRSLHRAIARFRRRVLSCVKGRELIYVVGTATDYKS